MTTATVEDAMPAHLTARMLVRLGQLSALDDGLLDDDLMRTVARVDLRPELAPEILEALTAAASPDDIDLPAGEIAWTSPAIMFTDTWTDEGRVGGGRMLEHSGAGHQELPLPLMIARTTSAMGQHDGAVLGGRIDSIDLSTSGAIPATGVFADNDEGRAAAWDYAQGYIAGVSVDLRITGYELDYITETDDDGEEWIVDADFRATSWVVMGATGTPFPAFADARIEIATEGEDAEDEPAVEPVAASMTAANTGGAFPWFPPNAVTWVGPTITAAAQHRPALSLFDDPGLSEVTAPTLDGDHYYGHMAPWQDHDGGPACHIGYSEVCVCAPHSTTGYSRFLVGEIETADAQRVAVGTITLRGGHAPLDSATHDDVVAHYDDTDSAVAYVTCGEDDHGIWFSGVVRPGISDDDRFALAAASLSGDWREWPVRSGTLELVRVCCVNTPGFAVLRADGSPEAVPMPRATVEDGRVVAIAASGAGRLAALKSQQLADEAPVTRGDLDAVVAQVDDLDARVSELEAMTDGMEPEARARLLARLSA